MTGTLAGNLPGKGSIHQVADVYYYRNHTSFLLSSYVVFTRWPAKHSLVPG
jgi:hypothetical protein